MQSSRLLWRLMKNKVVYLQRVGLSEQLTPSLAIGFGNSCQVNQPPNKINKFCRQHSIRRRAQQLQKPIKYPIDGIEALTIAFQYDGKRVKVTRARESGIVAMQHSRLKSILKVTFMMALCL